MLKEWREDHWKMCCIGQFKGEAVMLLNEKYYGRVVCCRDGRGQHLMGSNRDE
jgi:hypothetical protein